MTVEYNKRELQNSIDETYTLLRIYENPFESKDEIENFNIFHISRDPVLLSPICSSTADTITRGRMRRVGYTKEGGDEYSKGEFRYKLIISHDSEVNNHAGVKLNFTNVKLKRIGKM